MSRMLRAQVAEVGVGAGGGMAALLADVDLGSALVEGEGEVLSVDLATVRLERTPLGEGLATRVALVGLDTCHKVWDTETLLTCSHHHQARVAKANHRHQT